MQTADLKAEMPSSTHKNCNVLSTRLLDPNAEQFHRNKTKTQEKVDKTQYEKNNAQII